MNRQRQQLKPSPLLCALAGLVILVWTLGAEGEESYSYNPRGDASKGPGGKYNFTTSEDYKSGHNRQPQQPAEAKDDPQVIALPVAESNGNDQPVSSGSNQNKQNNSGSSPANSTTDGDDSSEDRNFGGIMDSRCTDDKYCKDIDPKLMCCFKKDGDAISDTGTCQLEKDCKQDGGGDNKPPPGDGPGGQGSGGGSDSPQLCKSKEECSSFKCEEDNDYILEPDCDLATGQCFCKPWAKYQCYNNGDCATWANKSGRTSSIECPAENFECEGASDTAMGQCKCQSQGQCNGQNNGSSCSGCKMGDLSCEDYARQNNGENPMCVCQGADNCGCTFTQK